MWSETAGDIEVIWVRRQALFRKFRIQSAGLFAGVERKGSAYGQSDANDPGCVKTPTANLRVEIFVSITLNGKRTALAVAVEGGKGENNSAHSLLAHVFTQPGPIADLSVVCVDGQPKHAIEGCLAAQLFAANRA
jgi:hypothetical protein